MPEVKAKGKSTNKIARQLEPIVDTFCQLIMKSASVRKITCK